MRTRSLSILPGLLAVVTGLVLPLTASGQAPAGTAATATASATPSVAPAASAAPTTAAPAASGAPAASAAPTSPTTGSASTTPPKTKKVVPPSPPPTPSQLKAFQILQQEAADYEKGTKDFRRNLTMIVRHHYEERRKRVLSALDRELSVEKRGLDESRDEAITRLEEFVARYSGANADPRATPDAMFRLGALYEEKARARTDADLSIGLEPAVAIYRRIIKEFPQYEETAAVHYYLGHSFTDAGRIEEGQQAWRALACSSRYTVQDDPKDAGKILLQPMPQDHDDKFWNDWYNKNPVPLDQARGKRAVAARRGADKLVDTEELSFADPYDGCKALPQKVEPGEDPRYLAEIWWQLGNFHFDQIDPHGGPYNLNRAVVAYQQSMQYKKPPIYGVSLYKLAWTYFKQQRYHTAVDNFVQLLGYADEQEAKTGDPGADFRQEAFTYIAGSLTFVDFDGPPAEHPYIPRSDVLDTEPDPLRAEEKMAVAIARVQDPKLIPYASKALEARTKLAAYVGTTPWVDANRDDPEALTTAEQLVKGGLKRAAADHTNFARGYKDKALELNDPGEQRALVEKAIAEYRLAESGWNAYLEQDAQAMDAYESRFWLADSRFWVVVLQAGIGRTPQPAEVKAARDSAASVRDSNEDDKYLQPSAYYVVTIAEKVLEDQYRVFQESNGQRGIEKREELKFSGEGDGRKVVKDPVPQQVLDAVKARDEYNERIPLDRDPQKNGLLYSFQSADLFFVYGDFENARKRFTPIYDQYCGVNEWGYKAWEKLISMSNFEGNAAESRRLAEGKSCAYDAETKKAEDQIRKPVKQGVAYLDARKLYEEAEKMPDGPERNKKWREAAAAYKVALDSAPDRDEAPEAAMNGAFAYKQVGEYDKAIEMYELFISRYGNEKTLGALKNGDAKAKPPVAAQPKKYEERVKYLQGAYDALAGAYVLFFNYPRAAETYDKISTNQNFDQKTRRDSARQGLSLYASLGDRGGMTRARERFATLGASPKETAEADFIVASAELKRWDPYSGDEGANGAARRSAQRAMEDYYTTNKNKEAAAQYVVQAAYWAAKTRKAVLAGDTNKWWTSTIEAFDKWKRVAPQEGGRNSALGSKEANMAAEADFTMQDEELARAFDYETGHHRYRGTMQEVVNNYNKDAVEAKRYYDKLQKVIDTYVSPEWTTAAIARQGSLYDSLRTGLYNTRPPELKIFDAKTEALLKRAENSDNPDLQEKADAARVNAQKAWRDKRDQELNSADQIMIDRYGNAVVLAKRYNVSNPQVIRAIRRLAFFTDVIGEAKMKQFTAGVKELNYTEGMFPRMRPGISSAPPPNGSPAPLPAFVQ
ncbi:MAG: hypothetical protein K0R38_5868 [Polyangiaceae bacterium]|nr:hypothetical protein [Polyangiaceae bacterium]